MQKRIAIVGGGPGGLTLARILHQNGREVTVLEREASFIYRPQGGSLDIHADSGQIALAKAGLTAEFQRIARHQDQQMRLAELVGHGLTFSLGDRMGLMMHRDANAHIGFYAAFHGPVDVYAGKTETEIRAELMKKFSGWGSNLTSLIAKSDDVVGTRGIYWLPPGHRWKHVSGVTLIGDAAHVMSPFGGDGANFALQDAGELAEILLRKDWRDQLPLFEEAMAARCEGPAAAANAAILKAFASDGFTHSFNMMQQLIPKARAFPAKA